MQRNIHAKEDSCKSIFMRRKIHVKDKELFQESIGQGGFA